VKKLTIVESRTQRYCLKCPLFIIIHKGLELIVQNLSRLDEANEEDAAGVHNTMAIIEVSPFST
jgi:hypothetical protein